MVIEKKIPTVSVIIPAFNQAEFLKDAVESVLCQTYRDFEIIVIDDGSTDDTPAVARQFGDKIKYIHQSNQGLSGARNTGILNAQGSFIALLDCDDTWQPGFLQTMMRLVNQNPGTSVYYCNARFMDSEGHELPEVTDIKPVKPDELFEALVKADFLIPSTVVMLKSAVEEVGLFDQSLISCEDSDLWLRLSKKYCFTGSSECLVNYRLHGSSLSVNINNMARSSRAVVEKHFGQDDGRIDEWAAIKRLAYGGEYRYLARTYVLRQNNWITCSEYIYKALEVDPGTSKELSFFYDLAMGSQQLGYRGTTYHLDLRTNANKILQFLSEIFSKPNLYTDKKLKNTTFGTAHFAIGLLAYKTENFKLCRQHLLLALRFRPELWRDHRISGDIIKSFLGPILLSRVRKMLGKNP